jgi:hypothetical protein
MAFPQVCLIPPLPLRELSELVCIRIGRGHDTCLSLDVG